MRKILFIFSVLLLSCFAWAEDEIVIEMHGDPTPVATPTIWQKSAPELARALRGTTRQQLLYTMPAVSDKDRIVRNSSAEYALVEYYNNGHFRKFLFKAEDPQTFITVAATPADVLAVNKKYKINIGLKRNDFLTFYNEKVTEEKDNLLSSSLALYKLSYQDINTTVPTDHWFLFEREELTLCFESTEEKENYLKSLRQKAEAAQAKPTHKPAPKKQVRTTRKALLSGGTLHDRMYMPRVTNSKFVPPAMLPDNGPHPSN